MCDTCQDCDNLTIPSSIAGSTGPAGATGAAGANGVNGATILYNDLVAGSTSSATYALFSVDKVYNAATGTLSANGDKLEITSIMSLNVATSELDHGGFYQILIGGTDIAGGLSSVPYGGKTVVGPSDSGLLFQYRVKLDISRISSTSIMIHSDSYWTNNNGQVIGQYHFTNLSLTVPELSTNAMSIQVKGKSTRSGDSMICNQLNVNNLKQ